MVHEVDEHGLSLRMIQECNFLATELDRSAPRPVEVCRHLENIRSCGVPATLNYPHLRSTGVLDHLASGIAAALGFHPSSLPDPSDLHYAIEGCKEILYQILQSCGKFQEVVEGEDDLAYNVQGIYLDGTFEYDSDRNPVEGDLDQEEHAAMLNHMEHEERNHNTL